MHFHVKGVSALVIAITFFLKKKYQWPYIGIISYCG